MYQPKSFVLEDSALIERVIAENSFALLVSNGENGLEASHLPFEFDSETQTLISHMARANGQWRRFDGREAMVVFSGPHGYISPSWYETELAVPTWNYVVVHAYGVPRIIENDEQVEALLTRLEAKAKLSQNRPLADIEGAIAGLERDGNTELAEWMRRLNG